MLCSKGHHLSKLEVQWGILLILHRYMILQACCLFTVVTCILQFTHYHKIYSEFLDSVLVLSITIFLSQMPSSCLPTVLSRKAVFACFVFLLNVHRHSKILINPFGIRMA